jgi:hypothetical protein
MIRRWREKDEQAAIVKLCEMVGGKVYVLGRPPRHDAVYKGTGQTPGIPDLLVHLPSRGANGMWTAAHQVWVEVKARGGRLRPEQRGFRDFCELAGIPHIVGGLDAVVRYLGERGYVKETPMGEQGRLRLRA